MPTYSIKEIYYTIQGEGRHAGRPAIFCRFSGCNLWTGLEKDRDRAICQFCDTDFWGTDGLNGGKYSAEELTHACLDLWPDNSTDPFIVCTGGEPLLQLDNTLISAMKARNFFLAIESNGTIAVPDGLDWVCISPKENATRIVHKGDELKLIYPQGNLNPQDFEQYDFAHFSLQPMDNHDQLNNIKICVDYCKKHPKWHLSLQIHKILGLP